MLDLQRVDLGELSAALEDHSAEHSWWIDAETGEIVLWSDYTEEQGEPDPESRGLHPIEPIPSQEAYAEMEDFIRRVDDRQAQAVLERAISGRGAFRRFKDALLDAPDLRTAWFRFHDARLQRSAIGWLSAEGLVDHHAAERALAAVSDPEIPALAQRESDF